VRLAAVDVRIRKLSRWFPQPLRRRTLCAVNCERRAFRDARIIIGACPSFQPGKLFRRRIVREPVVDVDVNVNLTMSGDDPTFFTKGQPGGGTADRSIGRQPRYRKLSREWPLVPVREVTQLDSVARRNPCANHAIATRERH